jgi:hypothetical protein
MVRSAMRNLLASVPASIRAGPAPSRTRARLVPRPGSSLLFISLLIVAACSSSDQLTAPRTKPAFALSDAGSAFAFTPLAFLGDAAPGGGTFINDFEPYGLNDLGEISFGADLSGGPPSPFGPNEGIFVARGGQISQIARFGQAAPGGGTFGPFFLGTTPINAVGEVAFVFQLNPVTPAVGTNAGLYRFSPTTNAVTPVVVPGSTPIPAGGVFAGVFFDPSLNNGGDIAFTGLVPTGFGFGVFRADRQANISDVASPGDAAPGGTFDFAAFASINDGGDVAFHAHLAEDPSPAVSVYLRNAATGTIQSIAHQGEAAPGGGTYRQAFGPVINSRGQVVFVGQLTGVAGSGLFLHSDGATVPIARPGDPMPGGGNLVFAFGTSVFLHVNGTGEVAFLARLSTGNFGLYVSSLGVLRLVAGTGTVIPGAGTIVAGSFIPGGAINERGELPFTATVQNASGQVRVVLVLATPSPPAA